MKKLSKVLAFALAFAMTLSMGSFAATFVNSEFSDIDQASNPDAISQLAALDVMNGYTDGTIRPQGDITRAEIAKMIYVIKMGGKDDGAAYYKSVKTNLTDIEGHWAEGYIKYCYSTGIIAGRDDNKFYPDDNVTGIELAKMLLVVQGYNAQKSGLVGAGWSNNVVELGAENEYFQGYTTLLNSAATREGAASIIVNALDATIVTWSDDAGDYIKSNDNKDTQSIGSKYFDLHTYEGILLSTGKYAINLDTVPATAGTEKNALAAAGKISVNVVKEDDKATKDTANGTVTQFTFDEDATELMGQYVKVSVGKSGKVYGIYAVTEKNTVLDTTVDKVVAMYNSTNAFDNKIEIDGKSYKVDTNHTDVYVTGDGKPFNKKLSDAKVHVGIGGNDGMADGVGGTLAGSLGYFQSDETYDGSPVRFIDNDGDGRFDIALVNPILGVRKVSATTSTSFSAGEKVNYDEVITSQKFSKGDWVVKTTNFYEDKAQYDLAKVVEGEVTSYASETRSKLDSPSTNSTLGAVELDDEAWYTTADKVRIDELNNNGAGLGAISLDTTGDAISGNSAVGGTRKLVVVGNVAYYNEVITSGASDIAFVTEGGAAQTTSVTKMKLMFSDGSTATVNCKLSDDANATANKAVGVDGSWLKWVADNTTSGGTATAAMFSEYMTDQFVGKLASYEVNDDGEYELTLMETDTVEDAGYGSVAAITAYDSDKNRVYNGSTSYIVDNNATVFVQYQEDAGKNKYTVITGEELLDFSKAFGGNGYVLTEKSGVKSATVILLIGKTAESMPGSEVNKGLAVMTSSDATTKIGSTTYHKITAWTLDGEKTLYISNSNFGSMTRGSSFTYNLDSSNSSYAIAKDVTELKGPASIYYVNGTKSVAVSTTGHTVAKAKDVLAADALDIYEVLVAYNALVARVAAFNTDDAATAQTELIDVYNNTTLSSGSTIGDNANYKIGDVDTDNWNLANYTRGAASADYSFLKAVADASLETNLNTAYQDLADVTADATVVAPKADATTIAAIFKDLNGYVGGVTATYTLASDVKVLNVETKTNQITGIEDDSISEAKEDENTPAYQETVGTSTNVYDKVYCPNAYFHVDDNEIDYIVIDINGEWALK